MNLWPDKAAAAARKRQLVATFARRAKKAWATSPRIKLGRG